MSVGKILIVDDLKLTLEIARSALKDAGCIILTATSGNEALEIVKREQPDLVIMDIVMPEMNGDECCKAIKKDPSLCHIPVILFSSAGRLEALDQAALAACDGILKKPFGKAEFLEKVQKHISIKCRIDKRIPVNYSVAFKNGPKSGQGTALNLSYGGMYVKSNTVLPEDSNLDIVVITNGAGCFEFSGKVAWVEKRVSEGASADHAIGMGIKFLDDASVREGTIDILTGKKKQACT